MSGLELYYARSGNSLRAAIALEETGLPFERRPLDLAAEDHRTNAFRALNPMGAVPVLVDRAATIDGKPLVLAQSGAILLHLAERSDSRLIPAEPTRRARIFQWFMAALSDVAVQNTLHRYLETKAPERSRANQLWLFGRLFDALDAFQSALDHTDHLDSDQVTIADLALFPVVHMRRSHLHGARFERLCDWHARMTARPAIARACTYAGIEL